LDHPNIIKTFDGGFSDNARYKSNGITRRVAVLAIEFARLGELFELLDKSD